MNDIVRFANTVEMLGGKKKGRRPVFSASQFYPYKQERELQGETRNEFLRFIEACVEAASIGVVFADDIEELSNLDPILPEVFISQVNNSAYAISRRAMENFTEQSEMIIGKPYYPPQVKEDIIKSWESNFQMLCKSAESDIKKDVSQIILKAKDEGWNKRQLEKAVKESLPEKYKNRAELIARTETAKLNTRINLETYKEIGIQYYTWMATLDGRCRDSHSEMNDRICSVADPNVYYEETEDGLVEHQRTGAMVHMHPGEDFQCRCSMVMWDPMIQGKYKVKDKPEEQQEKKEPTPLEKAREEISSLENKLENEVRNSEKLSSDVKNAQNSQLKTFAALESMRKTASENFAKLKFPEEEWNVKNGIKVSKNRERESIAGDGPEKLRREKAVGEIMQKNGHDVWLLPEKKDVHKGGKRPDAIMNGDFAEFKNVKGSIDQVWKELKKASIQSKKHVVLDTEKSYTVKDIIKMIIGKFNKAMSDNKNYKYHWPIDEFFFIDKNKIVHKIGIRNIWKNFIRSKK